MDFVHPAASFPFDWAHTLGSFFYCSVFRLVPRRWVRARLQLLSVLQHHANHSGGKAMVGGRKYDSDVILWLAVVAHRWVIVPRGRIWLPGFFLSVFMKVHSVLYVWLTHTDTHGHRHKRLSLFCARAEVTYDQFNCSYNLILSFFSTCIKTLTPKKDRLQNFFFIKKNLRNYHQWLHILHKKLSLHVLQSLPQQMQLQYAIMPLRKWLNGSKRLQSKQKKRTPIFNWTAFLGFFPLYSCKMGGGQKETQMATTSSFCLCINNYSQLGAANSNVTLAIASVQRLM